MQVKVLIPWGPGDGIQNYALRLYKEFKKDVKITFIKNKKPGSVNPFYFLSLALKSRKCDILHIQHNYCLFGTLFNKLNSIYAWLYYFTVKIFNKTKIITTMHDLEEPNKLKFYEKWYLFFMNFPVILCSDKIIVHKQETVDQLSRQFFNKKKIVKLPLGVDKLENILSSKKARKIFNVPQKKTIVLYGWIRPDKHYEKVIKILPKLGDVQILILGGYRQVYESYIKEIKKLSEDIGMSKRVLFKGMIPEKEKFNWLCCGDLFILPYSRISASGVLNDAISIKRPIITSKVKELVEMEEEYGVLKSINVDSETILIKTIKEFFEKNHLLKNQNKFIKENNREEVAKKTRKVYELLK